MRQNPNSRRSRGRGGRKPGNPRNQIFDSNGPGARVRGNSSQIYEKYQQLARDAASSGDRIAAENFYQHAEHYYRLMEAAGLNRKDNSQNESQQPADAPAPNGQAVDAAVEKSAGNGNAQAEVIDAAAETSSEAEQASEEKTNGSAEGEEQPKPARRSRSRRTNGAAKGEDKESATDADSDAFEEDTEPATA